MGVQTKVFPIHLRGVKAYLLVGEKAILVDTGMPGSERKILEAVKAQGIIQLELILLTHGHSDHIGSSAYLKEQLKVPVAIHEADATPLRTGYEPELYPTRWLAKVVSHLLPKKIKGFTPYEPDLLIKGEMSLKPYGIQGKVIETPGHTKGSISILLDQGELIVGDALMGSFRNPVKACKPICVQDAKAMEESLRKINGLAPHKIDTGHGGPFTLEDIQTLIDLKK